MSNPVQSKWIQRLAGLDDFDPINYLAIEILEETGNCEPSQDEIDQVEARIQSSLNQIMNDLKKKV